MELENIRVQQGDEVADHPGADTNSSTTSDDALELEWDRVHVSHGNKKLLFGVSGKVKGKFLAIMGGSGSGKVRFLSLIISSPLCHFDSLV